MLADEGIRVYGPGYLRQKGRSLDAMFNLSWSESPRPRRTRLEQLRFLAKGYKRLVFTEENFVGVLTDKQGRVTLPLYPIGAERVAELVRAWAPLQPQLFVAVRNPASFMASAYSQALYGGAYVGPRTFRARNDWRKVNWASYIQELRDIPGVGTIFVWRQEDYEASQRLILRRLLRWRVGGKVAISNERLHEGLSAAAVRQTLAWVAEGRDGDLARDARAAFPINDENKRFDLYAASTIQDATQLYAEQMARIEVLEDVRVLSKSGIHHGDRDGLVLYTRRSDYPFGS